MNKSDQSQDLKFIISESSFKTMKEIEVDSLPLCSECLIEINNSNFVCLKCFINFCKYHMNNHQLKFNDHQIYNL